MSEQIVNNISKIPLFESCSDEFLDHLAHQSGLKSYSKGKVLFLSNDSADTFYFIVSGWIKLFKETIDGSQAVIDILTTGHILGDTSLFQSDLYPYSAEIVETAEVITMPLSILKSEIESNPKLALAMLSSMARYRRQQDQEIENRTLKNAPQRIGCFLLRLAPANQTGKTVIQLPYDKTLVASRLGMQPETFSRALSKLKTAVAMDIKGATITIQNYEDLIEYACSACSSGFPCQDLCA